MPLISLVMGSKSDEPFIQGCKQMLDKLGLSYEVHIISAHREPEKVREYARGLKQRDIKVVIAFCGYACHLPGVIASYTDIPVLGVPLPTSPLKGIDSLFSIVEMPAGVPVACMGIGETGGKNAAIFAAKMLSIIGDIK